MKKLTSLFLIAVVLSMLVFVSCAKKPVMDGSYDFIIYESDGDNSDLSDNPVVVKYHIEYKDCQTVSDTLIKRGSAYFFSEDSSDYLILKTGSYGLYYQDGYFSAYSECQNGEQIDVSYSYTAVNGAMASYGIGETPLDGLNEYGFVINGWKTE